ncbi:MAG: hypothetical protein WC878_02425 [Candidatus Paceibacterota bacterium]|jgi:hypothetical protein
MKNIFYGTIIHTLTLFAFAANGQGVQKLKTPTPKVGTLFEFVTEVLKIVIKIGIPVVVVAIILSGYMFLTSQGDESKLKKAKQAIIWTSVGAAILLCAVVIATVIKNTIGQLGG